MSKQELSAVVDAVIDFCSGVESQCVKLRKQLEALSNKEMKASIPEIQFTCLSWKDEEGSVLKNYQTASKNENDPQKWNHTYNVLKANSAVIGKRFHEESYEFSYWLYDQMPNKIFRQKLKETQK